MYKHLVRAQRYIISVLIKENFTFTQIANHLQVSVSTVSREVKRNRSKRVYNAQIAQECADFRKERLHKNNPAIAPWLLKEALHLVVKEQWSPRQIEGYLARQGKHISHETIYKAIRADKANGGTIYRHCRHKLKHRKRPVGKFIPIKDRIPISKRPVAADGSRFGDWEMDTIVGKNGKGAIVTLVERSTDFCTIDDLFIEQIRHKKSTEDEEKNEL